VPGLGADGRVIPVSSPKPEAPRPGAVLISCENVTMRVRAGTSGFSYKEWQGSFYPASVTPSEYLAHYSTRLPTVEINSTFYRMPRSEVVASWFDQTPDDFRFVLKGSRRITHQQRLQNSADSVTYLFKVAAILQHKLGPLLFQLPPNLRKDVPRLDSFLALLPEGCRAALEFRHPSWHDDSVFEVLRRHQAALCCGDETDRWQRIEPTTNWGYLRLRSQSYAPAVLDDWIARIRAQPWTEAFVFFKHEEQGPALAENLLERCRPQPGLARAPALPNRARPPRKGPADEGSGKPATRPRKQRGLG
jgi:uncharacterized protein YecE (DUF72 family)